MASKIYPTVQELSTVNSCLPCSEEGCTKIFTSRSNLNLHLIKTHKHCKEVVNMLREYYCPDLKCVFNSEKFFKTLKLLKQHFLKVHCEKLYICSTCNKGFSTLASKNRHTNYCGVNFTCCNCTAGYMSYESLMTHGRRKNHKILEKTAYSPAAVCSLDNTKLKHVAVFRTVKKEILILPKPSSSLEFIGSINAPTVEKGSQTDVCFTLPKLKTKEIQVMNKHTKQSQTYELRRSHSSAETQTISDFISKRPRLFDNEIIVCNKSPDDGLQKSIKTQTKAISLKNQSCNTSFELENLDFQLGEVHTNSSSTQTNFPLPTELLYSISTSTHDSIHTDTSDLNFEFMHSSSQTCFTDDMSLFNSNYFNYYDAESTFDELDSYCQKAYDDIILNTIHTQTMFDDMARSVESQTMMSHTKTKNVVTNMETQTDDFKKLLEEINA
ncbi:hypothetical protein FQA39_LY11630 [Lamprigera yunnana]|nr:hypothetical protein FQA39_LY11630 [Lamprigera yunnana]